MSVRYQAGSCNKCITHTAVMTSHPIPSPPKREDLVLTKTCLLMSGLCCGPMMKLDGFHKPTWVSIKTVVWAVVFIGILEKWKQNNLVVTWLYQGSWFVAGLGLCVRTRPGYHLRDFSKLWQMGKAAYHSILLKGTASGSESPTGSLPFYCCI